MERFKNVLKMNVKINFLFDFISFITHIIGVSVVLDTRQREKKIPQWNLIVHGYFVNTIRICMCISRILELV